jgi:hypothetical protein
VLRVFTHLLFEVNDAVRTLDIRCIPKLVLNGRPNALARTLSAMCRGVATKSIKVEFDNTGVLLGDDYIIMNNDGGIARLFNALLNYSERTWNSYGRQFL